MPLALAELLSLRGELTAPLGLARSMSRMQHLFSGSGRIRGGAFARMSQPLLWGPVFLEASFGDVCGISAPYLPLPWPFCPAGRRALQTRLPGINYGKGSFRKSQTRRKFSC